MQGGTEALEQKTEAVRRRFILLGLVILATLAIGYVQMKSFIADHGEVAKIINETGRMRMLMTQIALNAERVSNAKNDGYRAGLQKTMATAIERFRHSYTVSTSDQQNMPPEILSHYTDPAAGLGVLVQKFLKQSDHIADHRRHFALGPHVYDVIAAPGGKLMASINHAIRLRENDWAKRLDTVHHSLYWRIGAVLTALIASVFYCINPLSGITESAIANARKAERSLEEERNVTASQRRFVSLVSHEFRTPLAIIDGHANRIIRRIETADTAYVADKMHKVRNAVNRLITLTENILAASKLESKQMEIDLAQFDLAAEIELVATNLSATNPDHEFRMSLSDAPSEITCDQKLMRSVLHILMGNAVKYAPDSDRIDIGVRRVKGEVVIDVRDYGIGIPEADLPKVGTRFFRASNAFTTAGTGIGLKLVSDILELHGGRLEITSKEGEGSTFSACFPMREAPQEIAA